MYMTLYYTHFFMGDRRFEAIEICGTEDTKNVSQITVLQHNIIVTCMINLSV